MRNIVMCSTQLLQATVSLQQCEVLLALGGASTLQHVAAAVTDGHAVIGESLSIEMRAKNMLQPEYDPAAADAAASPCGVQV